MHALTGTNKPQGLPKSSTTNELKSKSDLFDSPKKILKSIMKKKR